MCHHNESLILKLPLPILSYIAQHLPFISIFHFGLACKRISKILEKGNDNLWKYKAIEQNLYDSKVDTIPNCWKELVKEGFFQWEEKLFQPSNNNEIEVKANGKREQQSSRSKNLLNNFFPSRYQKIRGK